MVATQNGRLGTGRDDHRDAAFAVNILEQLRNCTELMRGLETKRNDKRRELAQHQRGLAERTAELQAEVADETDPNGKARYGNADSRKAELNARLRRDAQAKAFNRAIDAAEVEISRLDVEFDFARRSRANLLAVLEFSGRQLAYWSTHNEEENRDR